MQSDISLSDRARLLVPRPRPVPSLVAMLPGISERDRQILSRALHLLGGAKTTFGEALCAVRAAVEELIPAGRIYHLGTVEWGPGAPPAPPPRAVPSSARGVDRPW